MDQGVVTDVGRPSAPPETYTSGGGVGWVRGASEGVRGSRSSTGESVRSHFYTTDSGSPVPTPGGPGPDSRPPGLPSTYPVKARTWTRGPELAERSGSEGGTRYACGVPWQLPVGPVGARDGCLETRNPGPERTRRPSTPTGKTVSPRDPEESATPDVLSAPRKTVAVGTRVSNHDQHLSPTDR